MIAWIILIFSFFLAFYYFRLFDNLAKIWKFKTEEMQPTKTSNLPTVSIVIAFRNEADNLASLIESLSRLAYPKDRFEVIFVNDNSTDKGAALIDELMIDTLLNFTILESKPIGKKAALVLGAKNSKHDYLLFTDADVILPNNWIEAMLNALSEKGKMVCGPVLFENDKGFFNKWKQLEFIGLMSSSAAYIAANKPIMANGANLLIEKATYLKLIDQVQGENYASGDDVFLLHSLNAAEPGSISFAFNKEAIVKTDSPNSLKAFINQRLRWASKAKGYKNKDSQFLSLFVFLYPFILILFAILSGWKFYFIPPFLILLTVKMITDYRFFKTCLPFFNKAEIIYNYPLSILLHVIYIVIIGNLSLFVKPTWKGRKI